MNLVMHIDGGARGNPGPAGAGVVLTREDGALLHESAHWLGTQTNNAAEYHALIRGLERAARFKPGQILIHSDSELLVRQLTGEYRVRNVGLQPLFEQAQLLLVKTGRWQIRHVRREQNKRADELANIAMDRQMDALLFDVDAAHGEQTTSPVGSQEPADDGDSPGVAVLPADTSPPAQASADHVTRVRISVSRPPDPGQCPAGAPIPGDTFESSATLPAGMCVHAAHAALPTVLAIVNAAPEEVSAIPVMTVRCSKRDCRAMLHISPAQLQNGKA